MKNYKTQLLILSFIICNSIYSQHQVGHTTISFIDQNRNNRSIETEIYYPATIAGDNTTAIQDSFPVIVFGHGFVMKWDAYQNLWDEIVPRGYIMVFPRTEGSLFATNHQEFGWDLQFLVTAIQQEGANLSSQLYNVVATESALMGHSMGGGAAFLAADSLSVNGNQNLKTLIGLAPAESSTNGVSSINSALSITMPSVVFSGSQDGVTPAVDHHIPMYDSLASNCKTFINVIGGAHCYFANSNTNCDFGESTSSSGISITRTEQHQVMFDFLNNWLDYTLKYDCNAFDSFNDSLNVSNRITNNQICIANPIPVIVENLGTLTSSITGLNYVWYLDGSPIPNSNQVSIVANQPGNYEVEVFFVNNCSETSSIHTILATSVQSLGVESGFTFYPNPTSSIITFTNVKQTELGLIKIYNTLGQEAYPFQISSSEIDVSFLKKGIYFIQLEKSIQKLIIE
ncbi:T9SS type A sorting domain-containing protein [Vicingaceae bacterium]|nr:T9SS type A sorting domain-containing protein [Vicingaceae bacterium]